MASLNGRERQIIKSVHLFSGLTKSDFDEICQSILIQRLPAGAQLLVEGEPSQSMHVILKGSLEIYTKKPSGDVLVLAILTEGDVVGEDSFTCYPPLPRSASAVALEELEVAEIPAAVLVKFVAKYNNIKERLNLQKSMHTYDRLLKLSSQLQSLPIAAEDVQFIRQETYKPNDVIFSTGDIGDAIYFILKGQVNVVKQRGPQEKVIAKLSVGQLFGEISLLKEQPRAATVIADQDVIVLRIDKKLFKKWYEINPMFRAMLDSLNHVYHLQDDSTILTYSDKYNGKDSVNTIRFQPDGSKFISIKVLDYEGTAVFMNLVEGSDVSKLKLINYQSADGKSRRELQLLDNKLIGAVVRGPWTRLPQVIELILKRVEIPSWKVEFFSKHGELNLEHSSELIFDRTVICKCMQVTYSDIGRAAAQYGNDPDRIIAATGATLVCGVCTAAVNDLLGKTEFINLKISKTQKIANNIWLVKLQSIEGDLPSYEPGQYIMLMFKIADEWVQRSYTLTAQPEKNTWEILVLRRSLGTMSPVLTSDHEHHIQLKSPSPRGVFTITSTLTPTVFFASGIGVTPALAFLNAKTPGFFLHYSAPSEEDFVYKDELLKNPNVTLRNTGKEGELTFEEIKAIYHDHPDAKIMVCGSEQFHKRLLDALTVLKVPKANIKFESFSPDAQRAKKAEFLYGTLIPYFASPDADEVELFLNDVYAYIGVADLFSSRLKSVRSEIEKTNSFVPTPEEINVGIKKIFINNKINIDNLHILDRRIVTSESQRETIFRDHKLLAEVSEENIVITVIPETMEVQNKDYSVISIELTKYCHLKAILTLPKNISLPQPLRYESTTSKVLEPIKICYPKQEKWPIVGIFFRLKDILTRPVEMISDAMKEYGSVFKIDAPGLPVIVIGTKPYHDFLDMPPELATRGPIMMVVPTVGFWYKRTKMHSSEWMQSFLLASRRHIAEKLVEPNQLSKMPPIIKEVVKKHVSKWGDKIDLTKSLIELIYDVSGYCLVQKELWEDIREESLPLLRKIANGIDIPHAGVGKTPVRFFMPEYYATKKLQKVIDKVLQTHRLTKKYPYLDMLASMQVDGAPLPTEDLGWFFMYVIWNAATYPGTYGTWTFSNILSNPEVYKDLKSKNMDDRQILLNECFTETLRMFPVSFLVREVSCPVDYKHEGKTYRIPKKSFVGVFPSGTCHDKNIYADPEKFNPYRYPAGEKIPEVFASGPFSCIATQYSYLLLTSIMNELLNYFDFKLLNKVKWPQCRVHPLYPKKSIWVALRRTETTEKSETFEETAEPA